MATIMIGTDKIKNNISTLFEGIGDVVPGASIRISYLNAMIKLDVLINASLDIFHIINTGYTILHF